MVPFDFAQGRLAHHERRKAVHPERVEGLCALSASAVSDTEAQRPLI